LGSPIVFDYDPIFLDRFRETQRKVARVFGTSNDIVLMQGEAVLGLEAAAAGLVAPGTTCLNLVSGVYAKWYGDKLRSLGATVIDHSVPFDDSIDPNDVEQLLDSNPEISVVAIVHCDTPSGTLNPIREIGVIAKQHDALTICDVVSSLGSVEIRPDEWSLDICVAAPQKSLGGSPGLSMLTVSADAWAAMRRNPSAPRGSYLSILDWKDRWDELGVYPYTPSVTEVTGLEAACDEILEEGVEHAIARHERAARACRAGVRAAGLALWPRSDEIAAPCVTAVKVPEGIDEAALRQHIRDRYGVVVSGAQGELVGRVVRLGHMGLASRSLYPLVAVAALAQGLTDLGVKLDIGAAAEATLMELSMT
jgi:pyridoxamine--pyruvate transaminase